MMTPEQARRRVTLADEEMVPIDKIVIGVRRREKLRGIEHLAKSLETRGQIQPIGITEENLLVWGERRLAAAQKLGWTTIRCRRTQKLEPEDLRDLELDENIEREPYESHETTVDRARAMAAAEVAARQVAAKPPKASPEENQGDGISSEAPTKRGRPAEPGSVRAKASTVGVHPSTVADIDKAVALAARFPILTHEGWSRTARLEAGNALVKAHETGHGPAAERLIEAQPPARATRMLATLEALPPEPQGKLVCMLESREPEQVRNVQAILIDKTPVRPTLLVEWKAFEERFMELSRGIARRYPKFLDTMLSPLAGRLHNVGYQLEQAYSEELLYWERTVGTTPGGAVAMPGVEKGAHDGLR